MRYDVSKYFHLSACIHGSKDDGTSGEAFAKEIASTGARARDG